MRELFLIVIFVCLLFGCRSKNRYEKEIAVIDSTKIVLQVKLNELQRSDQHLENIGFPKYEIYSSFLKTNLKDTLSRSDATALQQFLNSGNTIKQYKTGKSELVHQTEMSIAQLQQLSLDVRENNIQEPAIKAYYSAEKNHAEELITAIEQNVRALNMSIAAYKSGLIKTEEYIRQINNGQLPGVVSDSTSE